MRSYFHIIWQIISLYCRGYVVSNFATDGFALLRGDRIYSNTAPSSPRAAKRKAAADAEEQEGDVKEGQTVEEGAPEDEGGSRKKARASKNSASSEYADKGISHAAGIIQIL